MFADNDGVAYFSLLDSLISLTPGPNSILNRTLAISESGDDLGKGQPISQSRVDGNSGRALACGTVSLSL